MTKRNVSESKAQAIHIAAMRIIDAEAQHRRLKTARLKELRLAQEKQAEIMASTSPSVAKTKTKRARVVA
jgi:hypothetical protein